ncbi:hypothetical protein AGOR_G00148610 [Albula goreensis]|uniref:Small integral membrane protein 24 n=1 Tax=Albula goreensis TaxID=1534307 RepID=A0A8T3D2T2_9TELE|nr:hypothetical protein AGOR_G00148610 [Albula goreensis]
MAHQGAVEAPVTLGERWFSAPERGSGKGRWRGLPLPLSAPRIAEHSPEERGGGTGICARVNQFKKLHATMREAATVCLWLLLTLETVSAQQVTRPLPNWLTGIIAVVVFLVLAFVAFLVNKVWCETSSQESKTEPVKTNDPPTTNGNHYEMTIDMVRSSDHENA